MRELRAWRCTTFLRAPGHAFGQVSAVVASTTQKEAAERLGITTSTLRNYGGQTWNEDDERQSFAEPGVVFWHSLRGPRTTWTYGRIELDGTVTIGERLDWDEAHDLTAYEAEVVEEADIDPPDAVDDRPLSPEEVADLYRGDHSLDREPGEPDVEFALYLDEVADAREG